MALAVGDKVEAAYRRGDLFQKRRQLAEFWGRFCVIQLNCDPPERVAEHDPASSTLSV